MGALDQYVRSCFENVVRGPEDMHDYQRTCVDFLLATPFSALFIDLGLGKTVSSLSLILELVTRAECEHALVIAPVRVASDTWPTEIGLWRHTAPLTYVHIREEEVVKTVNDAGAAERDAIRKELSERALWDGVVGEALKKRVALGLKSEASKARIAKARLIASRKAVRQHFKKNPATIHIINREQVEFLVDAWGRDWPFDTVIVDESSSLKDHTTNRFKALKKVRPLIKRMHQLTATPAAETYLHLFAQIYLLDQGERFGRSIGKFREQYFTHNQWTHQYKLRPGAEQQIAEKIADITLTMKAEDYLDLKEPLSLVDTVKLSDEFKSLYARMEDDYLITLPNGAEIEAETAAALSQKLLQMASGVIYETVMEETEDGEFKKRRTVHHLHDHKLEKLETIVEEAQGEPILVAYWHESSLARLQKRFPKAVVMDEKGDCIKAWNKGKIPMLLLHPQSGAHGLNLQHGGRRMVFFDIPWSLELYQQFVGRLARQGQKLVVIVHHLVAEGTLDEAVVGALREKRDAQEVLFKWLKKIRKRITSKSVEINNSL